MIDDLTEGIGNTGIKAGAIGECACSEFPFHAQEKKVFRAACRAQRHTGVAFTLHPAIGGVGYTYFSPVFDIAVKIRRRVYEDYLDIIDEENADVSKFYLSHAQGTAFDLEYQKKQLDKGLTLLYDCFGSEYYYDYPESGAVENSSLSKCIRSPTDSLRVRGVVELCKQGYDRQLVLSQDIYRKTDLKRYGGLGYSHILENIVPWLRRDGISKKQIRNMLENNPRNLLSHK
jgi:phosphotriesterase-related protein